MFQHVNGSGGPTSRRNVRRAVAVLACGAVVALPTAGFAIAADEDGCTPSEAWTETIPAHGEPQILVENPDYKPEVPEKSHWEHHPAEVVTTYQRYSWNPKGSDQQVPPDGSTPGTDDRWQSNNTNWKGEQIGVAFQQGGGNGGDNASWFFWTATDVVVKEAWDEKVIDQEYVPAEGEPTMWIDNPDYEPAQTIEHPAVTCPGPDPTDPPTDPTDPSEPTTDQPSEPVQEPTDPKTDKVVKESSGSGHSAKPSGERTGEPTRPVVSVTG